MHGKDLAPWQPSWWPGAWRTASIRDLQGGRFHGEARASLELPATETPWTSAAAKGFGLSLWAKNLELFDLAIGDPQVSLANLHLKAAHIHPRSKQAHLESLVCEDLKLESWNDQDNWHALGLSWEPTAGEPMTPVPSPAPGETGPTENRPDAPFLKIDRLQVSGIDWLHTDQTVTPEAQIPVRNGELEILRWATRGAAYPSPMRIEARADAGTVRAPARDVPGPETTLETRDAFDRMELRGRLSLATQTAAANGWLQWDVIGLELFPLRGWFETLGIHVGDGLLDSRNALRFRGSDGLAVDFQKPIRTSASPRSGHHQPQARPTPARSLRHQPGPPVDGEGRTTIPLRFEVSVAALDPGALAQGARSSFAALAVEAKAQGKSPSNLTEALFPLRPRSAVGRPRSCRAPPNSAPAPAPPCWTSPKRTPQAKPKAP